MLMGDSCRRIGDDRMMMGGGWRMVTMIAYYAVTL